MSHRMDSTYGETIWMRVCQIEYAVFGKLARYLYYLLLAGLPLHRQRNKGTGQYVTKLLSPVVAFP